MPLTLKNFNKKILNFTANTANSTVSLGRRGGIPEPVSLEISTNRKTWIPYVIGSTITLANIGDKVYFRNTSEVDVTTFNTYSKRYVFNMTGSISADGDITSLLNKNGTNTLPAFCFCELFDGCTSLTQAPKLPAKNISNGCYNTMFRGCTGLTKAPKLPATTLDGNCYVYMFQRCTSLIEAPELPATTLAMGCYGGMFDGCTSLMSTPELPATTLASGCYWAMFRGCIGLTKLPELPATTLDVDCYREMFDGCTGIKLSSTQTGEYQIPYRIPAEGTGITAFAAVYLMFSGTGGTFTGDPDINTTYYTSNTLV